MAEAEGEPDGDSLDDLFAAVKWDISVTIGDTGDAVRRPKGKAAPYSESAKTPAGAVGGGSNGCEVEDMRTPTGRDGRPPRRRTSESSGSAGLDLHDATDADSTAGAQSGGANALRSRLETRASTAGAVRGEEVGSAAAAAAAAAPLGRTGRGRAARDDCTGSEAVDSPEAPATPQGSPTGDSDPDPDLGHEFDLPPWPPM
jgi:hypothetical protein